MAIKGDILITSKSSFRPVDAVVWLLGLISLGFSFYATSIGFKNSIYDFHGFRQAQTAISAESMLHGGSFLHYETPVFGPPWSLPFEFPLYQGIVAGLAKIFSTPLDQTGRLVSISFYYLCFFPLASILSHIGMRGTRMIPTLALFAVSPLYVFVSRLFMIESTALFLSLMYADQMVRLVLGNQRWLSRHMAGALICGILAGLVKVTTFAPFLVLGASLASWGMWQDCKLKNMRARIAVEVAVFCFGLPVIATFAWTKFADGVKEQNPIGIYLISRVLNSWTFGTIAQRLHPRVYLQLWYAANNSVGDIRVCVIIVLVYVWLVRRWSWDAAGCLILYVGTILLFFNLHVVHEYYPYSNAVFLLFGSGLLISSILVIQDRRSWIGAALLMLQVGACGYRYYEHYYPIQSVNASGRPDAAGLVGRTTAPESVIVIIGLEWSAEFPYQSHRRAIMDAFFPETPDWKLKPVEQAIVREGPLNVAALVACDEGREGLRLDALLKDLEINNSTNLHADDCDIYERSARGVRIISRH
jgi:hypothetical protein